MSDSTTFAVTFLAEDPRATSSDNRIINNVYGIAYMYKELVAQVARCQLWAEKSGSIAGSSEMKNFIHIFMS